MMLVSATPSFTHLKFRVLSIKTKTKVSDSYSYVLPRRFKFSYLVMIKTPKIEFSQIKLLVKSLLLKNLKFSNRLLPIKVIKSNSKSGI